MAEPAEPAPTTALPATGAGKWLRIALILSLLANFLVVGLMAGAMVNAHWRGMHLMSGSVGFGPLTDALTRADRRELFRKFLTARGDRQAERQANDADLAGIVAALKAEPWDRAAVEAALTRLGDRARGRLDQGRDILVQRIAEMTGADRIAFAGRIADILAHGKGKGPDEAP